MNHHAGIDKCIFEVAVTSQELMSEERDVLDVMIEGYIERKVWRKVSYMHCF